MNIVNKLNIIIYRGIRLAIALLSTQYALMLEYRAEIILWAISGILPLIMLGIWQEAGISRVLGLNEQWLTRYFVSAFVVRQFTAVWVMVSFEEDNLEGRLSPYLLQPVMPFWRYYTSHIAEQISRVPIVFLILMILFLCIPDAFWFPDIRHILAFLLALFLGFTVRFLLHWLFSMICFWTDRASAIERLLLIPYLFLSGLVAPLEAFPSEVRNFAMFTPFPYILAFPSKILSEHDVDFIRGFSLLILWIVILISLSHYFWHKGIKKFSGMGA